MVTRFALASSAGITVDGHFARAEAFYIYEVENGKPRFFEKRILRCPGGHTTESIEEKKSVLSDCNAIFVNRIGASVAEEMIRSGFRIFEAPLPVDTILWQIEAGRVDLTRDGTKEEKKDEQATGNG